MHVLPGISLAFALFFFVPLFLVAVVFLVYCTCTRRSVIRVARVLSALWLIACIPASLMIVMGYAFNSDKMNPLLAVPLWVFVGLLVLWLPVAVRAVFGIRPV